MDSHSRCFFFMQKTAYDMRISDWSSDVCSSDLAVDWRGAALAGHGAQQCLDTVEPDDRPLQIGEGIAAGGQQVEGGAVGDHVDAERALDAQLLVHDVVGLEAGRPARSEEHTSELQSLMRIPYAVFLLKKKNKTTYTQD